MELHQMLTRYAYEVYDTLDHPALGQSPREAFEDSIAQTDNRAHRKITYDRDFLIFTLPTTRKGTAFAFVDRQWVECHSEYSSVLHGHSEREVHLASEE